MGRRTRTDKLEAQVAAFVDYLSSERRSASLTVETYCRDLDALRRFARTEGLPADAASLGRDALRRYLAASSRHPLRMPRSTRSGCATARCWNCSMAPQYASANFRR